MLARERRGRELRSASRIVVLASGTGTNLQAILDTLHGRDGFEVVGVGSDKRERGRWGGRARRGSRPRVFPREEFADRAARDAGDGRLDRGPRRRPRRPRRLHAAAQRAPSSPASATASSTSTPRCCRPSPASTRSGRRSRRGSRSPGSPSTSSTRASTPGRRSSSARCRCPPSRDREELEKALHAVEHELYPEAIRMLAEGRVRIDADDPRRRPTDERGHRRHPQREPPTERRDPRAPRPDLGLRQDRGRRLRQEPGRARGRDPLHRRHRERRCARPASRSPTSPSSPARKRSSTAG